MRVFFNCTTAFLVQPRVNLTRFELIVGNNQPLIVVWLSITFQGVTILVRSGIAKHRMIYVEALLVKQSDFGFFPFNHLYKLALRFAQLQEVSLVSEHPMRYKE